MLITILLSGTLKLTFKEAVPNKSCSYGCLPCTSLKLQIVSPLCVTWGWMEILSFVFPFQTCFSIIQYSTLSQDHFTLKMMPQAGNISSKTLFT